VKRVHAIVALALIVAFTSSAMAADIWVKAGAKGKGKSKDKPVGYLWKAVDKAKRGDVIHVAQGTYNG
jgi:TRAP-type C4-dicarboxylate transport system substrate-binding protein